MIKTAIIGSRYAVPVRGALLADFCSSVRAYGRLDSTTDMKYASEQSEIMFISVGTPARDEYDALENADTHVLTDWSCFYSFCFDSAKRFIKDRCFFGLHNMYKWRDVENAGFLYKGVGA